MTLIARRSSRIRQRRDPLVLFPSPFPLFSHLFSFFVFNQEERRRRVDGQTKVGDE